MTLLFNIHNLNNICVCKFNAIIEIKKLMSFKQNSIVGIIKILLIILFDKIEIKCNLIVIHCPSFRIVEKEYYKNVEI